VRIITGEQYVSNRNIAGAVTIGRGTVSGTDARIMVVFVIYQRPLENAPVVAAFSPGTVLGIR